MRKQYSPDLAKDAAECDANYLRLCRLIPADSDKIEFGITARGPARAQLTIDVDERCRYTTMLTVRFNGILGQWAEPGMMRVRVYHDLSTAEVIGCNDFPRLEARYQYPNPEMHLPNEKSQMNRFLGDLLINCLEHGHTLDRVYFAAEVL